jgi:uncharacterized protein with ParB-like and HNH nuclease domain
MFDAELDEYDLDASEGIEDETAKEPPSSKQFSISSYGADYTVDSLVKRMQMGAFEIPEFQRKFVWTRKHASKFLESLLMGLPVPGIFLYRVVETNRHLVIDGQQRLKSLQAYYEGVLAGREFRLEGVREPWNGKSYKSLTPSDRLKLDDSIVHATIFRQEEPEDVLDSVYFVFERINSGGIRLSQQEIRKCVSAGDLLDLVTRLNDHAAWRSIIGKKNLRGKDEELILRFLALYENHTNYSRPMSGFLNAFSESNKKMQSEKSERLETAFNSTVECIFDAVGTRAFRIKKGFVNAAALDAIMVGLATRIADAGLPSAASVAAAYDQLMSNKDFLDACDRSTADDGNVRTRIDLAIKLFGAAA